LINADSSQQFSFIIQLTSLTLAPVFFAAAIYFSLARIVITFGAENSRIPPKYIPRIFITCDVISLILQAAGGALSAWYASKEEMPDNGNFTMMGGLSFQAFTLMVFLLLSADFAIRTIKAVRRHGATALNEDAASRRLRRSKRFRVLLFSLTISAVLIFMRSIYRVIEISEGWKGELMSTEKFVIWLEAIPVAISGAFLCIFHPANCFKARPVQEDEQFEMPDTPPSVSSVPQAEPEKYRDGSRYGSIHVTVDPTFDRKNWR
jgi:RTA1 like protein